MRERVAAVALAVPFLMGCRGRRRADERDVAFRFTDPAIVESSGLVALDKMFVTVNDSGDSARIFVVDPPTGDRPTWSPGPVRSRTWRPSRRRARHGVWVGDLGDNTRSRAQRLRCPTGRRTTGRRRGVRADLPRRRARRRGPGRAPPDRTAVRHQQGRLRRPGLCSTARALGRRAEPAGGGRRRHPGSSPMLPSSPTAGTSCAPTAGGRLRSPGSRRSGSSSCPSRSRARGSRSATTRVYVSSEGPAAPVLEVSLPADVRTGMSPAPSSARRPPTKPPGVPEAGGGGPAGAAVRGGSSLRSRSVRSVRGRSRP